MRPSNGLLKASQVFQRLFKGFFQFFERPSNALTGLYPHLLESTSQEGVPGSPGKSQKEGQEDQGILKKLGGLL